MPNCFNLTRKGESEPATLVSIDREICALLGETEHPKWYCRGWFDSIGYMLATGRNLEAVRKELPNWTDGDRLVDLLKIVDYLEANYISDAWVEIGRRR